MKTYGVLKNPNFTNSAKVIPMMYVLRSFATVLLFSFAYFRVGSILGSKQGIAEYVYASWSYMLLFFLILMLVQLVPYIIYLRKKGILRGHSITEVIISYALSLFLIAAVLYWALGA
ncbi:MAG: hypothetical protein QXP42_02000 [Candidatus Micrarchaeia archaeon]